jgi:hypothetical protein
VSGVRGRRLTAFLTAGLLALVAAGCGGGDDMAPEVPGPPADVVIPESAEAPGDASASQDEGTTDESGDEQTDDTGTTDDSGGTTAPEETAPADPGTTTPDTSEGGTAAPEAEADGPTNDTPPPEGSNAEQFEDFCAQNPGAC